MTTYWTGPVGPIDDFGATIENVFYDAPTRSGPWAIMSPASWALHALTTRLGVGRGQRYERQPDGQWLKTQG